jgi:hypothetical protein
MDDHYHEATKPDAAQLEASKAEITAFRAANPTLTKTGLAVAFVEKRGIATSAELHTLLELEPNQYASVTLASAVQNGRLAKDGKNWMLGPKKVAYQGEEQAAPPKADSAVKPEAKRPPATPKPAPPPVEDAHEMLTFHPLEDSKPSNPKDAVGVRKAPMSTVSCAVLVEVGVAMLEGAAKYGRHNYRAIGVSASVYYDATMRHLMGWWEGEDLDPDSGLSHVTKAIASLVVLRDAMIQGKFSDDRPPRSVPFYPSLNAGAAAIIDRYADRKPTHYTIASEGLA